MKARRTFALAVAATVAVVAAGCGSSSDDTDTTPAAAAATTTAAAAGSTAKGDPIVIGAIGSFTGPNAAVNGLNDDAINAWVQATNADGGINGHPVKIIVKDDGLNATKAVRLVKELVEQDKVIALTSSSNATSAFEKYVAGKGVPVVGTFSFEQPFAQNPRFFPTGAQLVPMLFGALQEAKTQGKSEIGIIACTETPLCAQIPPLMKGLAGIVGGLDVVYDAKISQSQPNFTAQCLAAKGKGVDGMFVFDPAPIVVRVAEGCAQQGFTPTQFNVSGTTGPVFTKSKAMEGVTVTQSNPVLADTTAPGNAEFRAAFDKYVPGGSKSDQSNEENIQMFSGLNALKLALERGKVTPTSTSADVLKGLYTFKQETVGGQTPPLTYVKGAPTFVGCWFTTQVKDGKFIALQPGGKPSCITPAQGKQLAAVLGGGK